MAIQLKVSPANTLAFALPRDSLKLKRNSSLSHGKHTRVTTMKILQLCTNTGLLLYIIYIIIKIICNSCFLSKLS